MDLEKCRQSAGWLTLQRKDNEETTEIAKQKGDLNQRHPSLSTPCYCMKQASNNPYTLHVAPPLAAISRAAFAPSTCSSVGSDTPFFAAVTSARIDTAISGGVLLPI
jgi:hypothetical protein